MTGIPGGMDHCVAELIAVLGAQGACGFIPARIERNVEPL
ncbi:hypothetical protein O972_05595 [Mycobacterium avium subsp. avium 10-9275]|nr:hypothetical protein P863_06625 [Mycobacterium avium subsp. silvaticum ATCC 49884]ETB19533.1 hypothetical protein O972_05595 [Mycobacterium avium subsp. avium 10-9275]ETB23030.1 hypothetical protein O973_05515 [Mycobacterium avium subsp. avium 11-4751]